MLTRPRSKRQKVVLPAATTAVRVNRVDTPAAHRPVTLAVLAAAATMAAPATMDPAEQHTTQNSQEKPDSTDMTQQLMQTTKRKILFSIQPRMMSDTQCGSKSMVAPVVATK